MTQSIRDFVEIDHKLESAKKFLNVNWCLTNICNFKCSYCPKSLHDGTAPGLDISDVKNSIDKIVEHYSDKDIFFEFTGGEVTYYKNFLSLLEYIKGKKCDIGIISNGRRELKYWQQAAPFLDHICLSYHSENNYSDHFVEVAKFLNQTTTVHVNIMMKPELFQHAFDLGKKVSKIKGVSIALQPLYEDMTGDIYPYNDEQKAILDKQMSSLLTNEELAEHFSVPKEMKVYRGEMTFTDKTGNNYDYNTPDILVNKLNNFKGWFCHAGLENLAIDMFGNIRRAWCNNPGVVIGNLRDDFSFPTTPIFCVTGNCHCGFDIMSKKVRKNS